MKNHTTRAMATLAVVTMLFPWTSAADPAVHKFQYWGTLNSSQKVLFLNGWTNGFLGGRGQRGMDFASCLESMSYEQSVAMIDKYYKDHPEHWSHPIGAAILEALTVQGGPCEGKNPIP